MRIRIEPILVVAAMAGCARNPVTGKSQLMLVSESQEIGMGREMLSQTTVETGLYGDSALGAYVSGLGLRLARASERPNLPWEFHVIDDPVVNAFAAPGGYVFVTRGILAHLNSEAELAAVLGHEIGHVTARHSAAMASQAMLAQGALAIGSVVRPQLANGILGQAAGAGVSLYFLNFSRNDERQADALGHRYALQAHYDPREMTHTFQTLQRVSAASGSNVPGFLSTHPDPGDRVQYTKAWADTISNFSGLAIERDRYLAHVNGIVFGEDPEQGYFEGARFVHPAYRFAFTTPAGWKGANEHSQVLAAEPNGAAEIVLTTPKAATPDAALQAFASQSGIVSLGTQRISLAGGPAMLLQWSGTNSNNQALRGETVFVQFGPNVFQFVGVATASGWSGFANEIDRSLRSLGPTQSGERFRQRTYLRVTTLRSATSMAELAGQSRGAITAQTLAIINGVDESATLPAGTRIKVVGY